MNDDFGPFCGIVCFLFLLCWMSMLLSRAIVNTAWENDLVDKPETIAVIRSRVLAERAELKAINK